MGEVWRARDERDGKLVALKRVAPELCADLGVRERARREAGAARSLAHPNVVSLLDAADDGSWLAFELVPGGSLQDRLQRLRRLRWREAARFGAQIARALACAHGAGLVHRDVKPSNVLLDEQGAARLGDFGLVRGERWRQITLTGETVGTVGYAAPEQLESDRPPGPAADLYSLGATIHALVAGEPPFGTGSALVVLRRQLSEAAPPLRSLAPATPAALERLVLRLLARDPASRPASASEVADELDAIASARERRSRPGAIVAALLLGAAPVVVIAAVVARRSAPPASLPAPPPSSPPPPSPPPPPSLPPPSPSLPPRARAHPRANVARESLHAAPIRCVRFVGRGAELVTGGDDGAVKLWNVSGTAIGPIKISSTPIEALAVSSDGVLLVVATRAAVFAVSRVPGATARRWPHASRVVGLAIGAHEGNPMIVAAQEDGRVDCWPLREQQDPFLRSNFLNPGAGVAAFALGWREGQRPTGVFGCSDGRVAVHDIQGLVARATMSGPVDAVAIDATVTRVVAGDRAGHVRVFTLEDAALRERLDDAAAPVTCVALAEGARFAISGHADGSVRRHDLDARSSRVLVPSAELGGVAVSALAIAPGGRSVAIAAGDRLSLWDAASGECLWDQER